MCRYRLVVTEYFFPPSIATSLNKFHLPGQITLSLSWFEEDVVIAGAKVICSRNISFFPLVSCYDGFIPYGTAKIVLSLPDVTKKYYVVAQIVRNFNGHELIEPYLHQVGDAFCTG